MSVFSEGLSEVGESGALLHEAGLRKAVPLNCDVSMHGVCVDDPFAKLTVARGNDGSCTATRSPPSHWVEGEDGLVGQAGLRARAGKNSLVVISDTDGIVIAILTVAQLIFDPNLRRQSLGEVFVASIPDRGNVSQWVPISTVVSGLAARIELQQAIIPGDSSPAAQLRRIQSYVMCIILCGGDTVSEFPGMPTHRVIDTYLEYAEYIGCLVESDSGDPSIFSLDFDAYLRWWAIMGTLRKTPFAI